MPELGFRCGDTRDSDIISSFVRSQDDTLT